MALRAHTARRAKGGALRLRRLGSGLPDSGESPPPLPRLADVDLARNRSRPQLAFPDRCLRCRRRTAKLHQIEWGSNVRLDQRFKQEEGR